MMSHDRRKLGSKWGRWHTTSRQPRGYALITTIGMLFFISSVLSLSAVLIRTACDAHRDALDSLRRMQQLNLACQVFRRDLYKANAVELWDDGLSVLQPGQRQVRYRLVDDHLERTLFINEQPAKRDEWDAVSIEQVEWDIVEEGAGRLASVKLRLGDEASARGSIQWLARCPVADIGQEAE